MKINDIIFKKLVKRGYSIKGDNKSWDVSDSKLWYLTPELSKGFLNLKKYLPYRIKVFDTEFTLIEKNAEKFREVCDADAFNLIDLGCGDGTKAEAFIKILSKNSKIRYCPVDVSQYFIDQAIARVKDLNYENVAGIKPFLTDFKDLDDIIGIVRNSEYRRNVILLLGETISTYEVNDLLYHLSDPLWKDDVLIVGNGYKVGDRFVELGKYRDSLFNDWFIHIVKGLGFNDNEVKIDARFANGRLEWFYTLEVDKTIFHMDKTVNFKKGDEIVVAIQYKFYENEWREFYELYFADVELLKDEDKEYAIAICKK